MMTLTKKLLPALLLGALPLATTLAAPSDLNTAFGTTGKVITDFGGNVETANDMAVQLDGKVLVCGSSGIGAGDLRLIVARHLATGGLDTTFGTSGKVILSLGTNDAEASGITILPNGKILVCGSIYDDHGQHVLLLRLNANGSRDTTFGTNGVVTTFFTALETDTDHSEGVDVKVSATGKIVVVGGSQVGGYNIVVARYNSDGTPDNTFDTDGKVIVTLPNFARSRSFALLADDSMAITAYYAGSVGDNGDFAVVRLDANGAKISGFGTNGVATASFGNLDRAEEILVQSDGKIVVSGSLGSSVPYEAAIVRFNTDGTLDSTFGTGGKTRTGAAPFPADEYVRADGMAPKPDGGFLVSGWVDPDVGSDEVMLMSVTSDGVLDTTLDGGDGIARIPLTGQTVFSSASVAVMPNGRYTIAGTVGDFGTTANNLALVQLLGVPTPDIAIEQPAGTLISNGSVNAVDFGVVLPNSAEITKIFTIRNSGAAPLTLTGTPKVQFVGIPPSGYTLVQPALTTIPVNGTTTFTLKFKPGAAGNYPTALRIDSNDPDEETTYGFPVLASVSAPVALEAAAYAVEEGSPLTVKVVRPGGGGPATVEIKTTNGTATTANSDYVALPTPTVVSFADGETQKFVALLTNADSIVEPTETFTLSLSNGNAPKGTPLTATVRIIDSGSLSTTAPGADTVLPPIPSIATPAANGVVPAATGAPITITGTATDARAVKEVEVSLDNFTTVVTATLANPGATSTAFTAQVIPAGGSTTQPFTVKARSRDYSHTQESPEASRIFRVSRPLLVTVNNSLMGAVPTTFISPVPYFEPGSRVTITATPKVGHVFNGWQPKGTAPGGVVDFTQSVNYPLIGVTARALEFPTLTFTMQEGLEMEAMFIPNPFGEIAGIFTGLAESDDTQPTPGGTRPGNDTEGFFTATVQPTGSFSGKLTIDGLTLNVAGVFDNTGHARFGTNRDISVKVTRPNKPFLEVSLEVAGMNDSIPDNERMSGYVYQYMRATTIAVSNIYAPKNFFVGTTEDNRVPDDFFDTFLSNGVPVDQMYTVLFEPFIRNDQKPGVFTLDSEFPVHATGYASMKLTKAGAVTMTGRLQDNTPFTYSGTVAYGVNGIALPFYLALYNNTGCITGPMKLYVPAPGDPEFVNADATNIQWFKPFQDVQHYPYGWPEGLDLAISGAKYTPPAGQSALPDVDANLGSEAAVMFDHGLLSAPITKEVTISTADVVTEAPPDAIFSLNIIRATGVISGNFQHSDGTTLPYYGVIWRNGDLATRGAYGYFYSKLPAVKDYTGEAGSIFLQAHP